MTNTLDSFQLTTPFRLLNALGERLPPLQARLGDLSPEALFEAAERQARLHDWGETEFRDGMRAMLALFEAQTNLTLLGRMAVRVEMLRLLTIRLQVVERRKRLAGVGDVPIRQPLFILGLPRTGTTLLHRLLGQDPDAYVPPLWQLYTPLPLTDAPAQVRQRVRSAEMLVRAAYMVAPILPVIHPIDAHEPEECVFLLPHNLTYYQRTSNPHYRAWFLARDLRADYAYYRQQLQLLRWEQPVRRMVMKSPFHLLALDALLHVFPDARIIQTHRDPGDVIPSWCSLAGTTAAIQIKHVDMKLIGPDWLDLWRTAMDRATAVRETANKAQFFDIQYEDLMRDPLAVVQRFYAQFGYDFTPEAETRMRRWLAQNQQHKHGTHRYSAEQFGLTRETIQQDFAAYIQRYGVKVSAGSSRTA